MECCGGEGGGRGVEVRLWVRDWNIKETNSSLEIYGNDMSSKIFSTLFKFVGSNSTCLNRTRRWEWSSWLWPLQRRSLHRHASACIAGQVEPFYKRVFHVTSQILAHSGEISSKQWRSLREIERLFWIWTLHKYILLLRMLSLSTNYLSSSENSVRKKFGFVS